jgi:hypothetical protein
MMVETSEGDQVSSWTVKLAVNALSVHFTARRFRSPARDCSQFYLRPNYARRRQGKSFEPTWQQNSFGRNFQAFSPRCCHLRFLRFICCGPCLPLCLFADDQWMWMEGRQRLHLFGIDQRKHVPRAPSLATFFPLRPQASQFVNSSKICALKYIHGICVQ